MAIYEEVYQEDLIQTTPEEVRAFKDLEKGLRTKLETVIKIEFKNMTRQNAESYYEKVMAVVDTVDTFVKENETDVNVYLKKAMESKKLAEKKGYPQTDPYYAAFRTSQEAIHNLSKTIKLRDLTLWALITTSETFLEMLKEIRHIEFEKQKLETQRTVYEDAWQKRETGHENLMQRMNDNFDRIIKNYEITIDSLRGEMKMLEHELKRARREADDVRNPTAQ